MRKLNNKGFAIASVLYSIMVLFLILLLSILGILGSRKAILDKNKKDIIENLNSSLENNRFIFMHRNITIVNDGNIENIRFALMDGVYVKLNGDNYMGPEYIRYNLDVNNIENGSYNVVYTANNGGNTITGTRKITFTNSNDIEIFNYTGYSQEFVPSKSGAYKVELWGASGGNAGTNLGGKGGYTSGNLNIESGKRLYVYVGGAGSSTSGENLISGGFNGGGSASGLNGNSAIFSSGGGSTDIRYNASNDFDSLKSRIMVAAGGGGTYKDNDLAPKSGDAGGLIGNDGISLISEYSAGTGGKQNQGGYAECSNNYCGDSWANTTYGDKYFGGFGSGGESVIGAYAGGGSGYYGGGASLYTGAGAGGGSSYISGFLGCNSISSESTVNNIIQTGQSKHYSGYVFKDGMMRSGTDEMPNYSGTDVMIGNSGNGFAKISLIYYYE